jgi:hypothetical protein
MRQLTGRLILVAGTRVATGTTFAATVTKGVPGMSPESRRLAGILLVVFPTVIFGGVSLLRLLIEQAAGYVDNPVRQDLWRAGHAHAGVCWSCRSSSCATSTRLPSRTD